MERWSGTAGTCLQFSYGSGLTQLLNYLVSVLSSPSCNINSTLELKHKLHGLQQALLFANKPGAGICNVEGLSNFCMSASLLLDGCDQATNLSLQSPHYRDRTQLTLSLVGQGPNHKPGSPSAHGFPQIPKAHSRCCLGGQCSLPIHLPAVPNLLFLHLYPPNHSGAADQGK